MTEFQKAVFEVTKKIPKGQTRTYAEVAKAIGKPRAYRAVANALGTNRSADIPCHRVIRSNGAVGGYSMQGGSKRKEKLLREEKAI